MSQLKGAGSCQYYNRSARSSPSMTLSPEEGSFLQIFHYGSYVCPSSIHCKEGEVNVYNSFENGTSSNNGHLQKQIKCLHGKRCKNVIKKVQQYHRRLDSMYVPMYGLQIYLILTIINTILNINNIFNTITMPKRTSAQSAAVLGAPAFKQPKPGHEVASLDGLSS